jgi:hypothetical protein
MDERTTGEPRDGAAAGAEAAPEDAPEFHKDRYADLRSRARSPEARELIHRIYVAITVWEEQNTPRKRKRGERGRAQLRETLERFLGDLLCAISADGATGRVYHALRKESFKDEPATYDLFMSALNPLTALGYVERSKGSTRYTKTDLGSASRPGIAPRFWPTEKLRALAQQLGITNETSNSISDPSHRTIRWCCATTLQVEGATRSRGRSSRSTGRRRPISLRLTLTS